MSTLVDVCGSYSKPKVSFFEKLYLSGLSTTWTQHRVALSMHIVLYTREGCVFVHVCVCECVLQGIYGLTNIAISSVAE